MQRSSDHKLNKFLHSLFTLAAACLLAAAICGCSSRQSSSASSSSFEASSVVRVSVILPHEDDIYWGIVKKGIEEHQGEAAKWNIDVRIEVPTLNYNVSQMTELVRKQIAENVDIIAVQGIQDEDYVKALNDAIDKGIQVVCLDTDVKGLPSHLYIGSDNYAAGKMIGEKLCVLMQGQGTVSIMSGDKGYPNLEERLRGIDDVFRNYPGISRKKVTYDHYDALTAVREYEDLEPANALICLEGTGVHAFENIIDKSNSKFSYIIGFDSSTRVTDGTITGYIKQDQYGIGEKLIEQLIYYQMHNGEFEGTQIFTKLTWVDASNYGEAENS